MHRLLETYLSEVSAHLGALPPKRRAEELREMRAHLENAIVVSREMGRSEADAGAHAVEQFGTARDLGENLVWAWRRGVMQNKRSFWGVVVSMPLMLTCLLLLQNQYIGLLDHVLPLWFNRYCAKHPDAGMALVQGVFLMTFGLSGFVAGSLFPKRAVRGALLGLAAFWLGWIAVMGVGYDGFWGLLTCGYMNGWTLAALASAWAGSRARRAWGRRAPKSLKTAL